MLRGERTLARGIAFIQTASERGRERQVMKPVHILASLEQGTAPGQLRPPLSDHFPLPPPSVGEMRAL